MCKLRTAFFGKMKCTPCTLEVKFKKSNKKNMKELIKISRKIIESEKLKWQIWTLESKGKEVQTVYDVSDGLYLIIGYRV